MPPLPDILLTISRSLELSLFVKATLVVAAGLGAATLARGARASVRHVLLASTLAALVALPLAAWNLALRIDLPVSASPVEPVASSPAAAVTEASADNVPEAAVRGFAWPSWYAVARAIWAAGAIVLLAQLGATLWRLRRLRRTSLPWPEMHAPIRSLAADAGIDRDVDLALHEDIASPLTFGTRHPLIVLPPDARHWDQSDLRRALVHELEHVRRCDWALQTAARAVCAAWWFHPLVWVAWRRLSLEAERACDDAVVVKEEAMEYAEQLVSLAERLSAANAQPTLGMANRSDLSARVSSLLDGSRRRGRPGRGAVAAGACAALMLALAIAPLRAVARTTEIVSSNGAEAASPEQRRVSAALGRELYEASMDADLDGMTELIRAGADVNATIDGDGSPLIAAVRSGDERPVLLLLSHGADPNLGVPGDGSPLIAAVNRGRLALVTLLLDRGANVNLVIDGDENALMQAAAVGHLEIVRALVSRGADVNARVLSGLDHQTGEREWRTALGMAKRGGHQAVAEFLIANGARDAAMGGR